MPWLRCGAEACPGAEKKNNKKQLASLKSAPDVYSLGTLLEDALDLYRDAERANSCGETQTKRGYFYVCQEPLFTLHMGLSVSCLIGRSLAPLPPPPPILPFPLFCFLLQSLPLRLCLRNSEGACVVNQRK